MFERIQRRFGTAGLIVAVVALVAALGGSAVALTGSEKRQINKQIKKEAKKWGKRFARTGPAGPQGLPGANGVPGTNGQDGANGTDGSDGTDGNSVALLNEAPGGCAAGGYTYEIEGSGEEHEVCNGEDGQTGFTATLPGGETETGVWSFGPTPGEGLIFGDAAISFAIPLATTLDHEQVHYINPAGKEVPEFGSEIDSTVCTGTVAAPTAAVGHLCVYAAKMAAGAFASSENIFPPSFPQAGAPESQGTDVSGAWLRVPKVGGPHEGHGTFAVTAP